MKRVFCGFDCADSALSSVCSLAGFFSRCAFCAPCGRRVSFCAFAVLSLPVRAGVLPIRNFFMEKFLFGYGHFLCGDF